MFFPYQIEHSVAPVENFIFPQSVVAGLRPESPIALQPLYYKALQLNWLVMLVTDTLMPLTSIQVRAGGGSWTLFKHMRHDKARKMEHYQLNPYYTDIQKSFQNFVNDWFELYNRHEKSLELYFDTKTNMEHMTLDIRFLRFAQSLEAFHREDDPESKNLAESLKALLEIPYEILEPGKVGQFIERTKKIRDYLSHGILQHLESDMPSGKELGDLVDKLELVMYGNLIHKLSISKGLKSRIMARKFNRLSEQSYESG